MKNYLFDLDGTLLDTSKLKPYRNTNDGMNYVSEHPEMVPSALYSQRLVSLVNELGRHNKASVVTNAPSNYSIALLKKHGFNVDAIKIYAEMKKPSTDSLPAISPDTIMIGDTPVDIFTAHALKIPSIAVFWGIDTSTITRISKSEPSRIAPNIEKLEEMIGEFESNRIVYEERKDPANFKFAGEFSGQDPEINPSFISTYYPLKEYPYGKNPNYEFSSNILRVKESKGFHEYQIKKGARSLYFNKGGIKRGAVFKDVLNDFLHKLEDKISSMNLKGSTAVLASPNSMPEYGYLFDVNHELAKRLNARCFGADNPERIIHRVYPKYAAHQGGSRGDHYSTIGIRKDLNLQLNLNNIILFDDVCTTGSQMNALGHIIRELCGFQGNLHFLSIGKTFKKSSQDYVDLDWL